ncbi:hypothetical protein MUK42_03324 [Musa troglodytarum]|uniref:Uncharacterized protein n=1 Tax=Musa troglodytarum TaxID=320322 RepID=A0A9E7FBI5_9LILI|nr:hypothetical protein MUK42_03324 [Musa troglodytarum]
MGKWWFHSMLSNEKLEHRCGLSKSMYPLDGIGHTSGSEQPILNNTKKKIPIGIIVVIIVSLMLILYLKSRIFGV